MTGRWRERATAGHHFRHHRGHAACGLRHAGRSGARCILILYASASWHGLCAPGFKRNRGQHGERGLERLAGRDLANLVRMQDGGVNFSVAQTHFSRLRNVVLHAGRAIAAHRSAKRHQFKVSGTQIMHDVLQ